MLIPVRQIERYHQEIQPMFCEQISGACVKLRSMKTRGDLGQAIAAIVQTYSPRDIERMRWNFSGAIRDINPELRKLLEKSITDHLQGTYQALRLMDQHGSSVHGGEPLAPGAGEYWKMVAAQCPAGGDNQIRLRFLKFLLAGFCMFVQGLPGHPVGMPFPGGDRVTIIEGVYYCPVREKANDVDAALCPYCPALQTPEIGYLKPPVNAGEHRKQEFIRHCHDFHHFNG
jgi:uncharacterized protein (UPF0305 family)